MAEDKSEEGVEQERETASQSRREESSPRPRASGGMIAAIGVLAILGGGALAALPWTLPEWSWVAGSASKYGVSPGGLVLTGLVLWCIGSVSRRVRALAAADESESDEMLILEQLVLDFTKLRDGIQELRPELSSLKESTAQVLQAQQAHAEAQAQAQAGEGQQDAIFRLAASLDQVGARIEQRLTTLQTEIGSALTQASNAMAAAQSSFEGQDGRGTHESGNPESYGRAVHSAQSSADGWVEIDTGSTHDLGLLDSLDEHGQVHSPRVSLSSGGPRASSNGPVLQGSPLPHATSRQATRGPTTGDLLGRDAGDGVRRIPNPANEVPMGEKLDQLKALLADSRVRRALDLMQSEGPSPI